MVGALSIPPGRYIISCGTMSVACPSGEGSGYRSSGAQGKYRMDGGLGALRGSMVLRAKMIEIGGLGWIGPVVGL